MNKPNHGVPNLNMQGPGVALRFGRGRSREKNGIPMSLRWAASAALAISLCACGPFDTLREGFAHSEAVSKELEKSLGLKSFVGFNWNNGSLRSVNVTFEGLPVNGTLAEISEKSKQAVIAEFKQTPEQIVIAFTLKP